MKICHNCGDECEDYRVSQRGNIYCGPCFDETPEGEKEWEECWVGEGVDEDDNNEDI